MWTCISTIHSCLEETRQHPIDSAWLTLSDVSLERKPFHSCMLLNCAEAGHGDLLAKQMWSDASVSWLYSFVSLKRWCYQQTGSLNHKSQTKKSHILKKKKNTLRNYGEKRRNHGLVHLVKMQGWEGFWLELLPFFSFFFFLSQMKCLHSLDLQKPRPDLRLSCTNKDWIKWNFALISGLFMIFV